MQLAKRSWKCRELLYLPFQEDIHLLEYGLDNNGDAGHNEVDVQFDDDDDDDKVEVGCDGDGKSEAETDVRERKDLPDSTFFH